MENSAPKQWRDPMEVHLVNVLGGQNLPGNRTGGNSEGLLDSAARALAGERARVLAKKWPGIVDALGKNFVPLFEMYALDTPRPRGGAKEDAHGFLLRLRDMGRLPDKLGVTLLRGGIEPRALKVARLQKKMGVAVAVRVPWVGVKVWEVGVGRGR